MDLETLCNPGLGLFPGPETPPRELLAKLSPSTLIQSGLGSGLGLHRFTESIDASLPIMVEPGLDRRAASTDAFCNLTEIELPVKSMAHCQQPFPSLARSFRLESRMDLVGLPKSVELCSWSTHPRLLTNLLYFTSITCAMVWHVGGWEG